MKINWKYHNELQRKIFYYSASLGFYLKFWLKSSWVSYCIFIMQSAGICITHFKQSTTVYIIIMFVCILFIFKGLFRNHRKKRLSDIVNSIENTIKLNDTWRKLSFWLKLKFSNPYIFSTQCRGPEIFWTM